MPEALKQQIDRLERVFLSDRDPFGRAFVPLADAHRRLGELDRALEVLQEGLEGQPDCASGHVVAGWLHSDRGDAAGAVRAFERVLELDDENRVALLSLARLLEGDRALAHARRLIDLEPQNSEAVELLSALEAPVVEVVEPESPDDELEPVEAVESAKAVVPIESLAPEPEADLDASHAAPAEELDSVDEAAPEPPLEVTADSGEIYTQTLAELYAGQGAVDRAIEVYEKLLEEDPDNGAFRDRLAELRQGEPLGTGTEVVEPTPEAEGAPELVDSRPVVPIGTLAPSDRPLVPIESLSPDGDAQADTRPVVPIQSLAPDDGSGTESGGDPFPWMNKL